jgi:hypothetical protein
VPPHSAPPECGDDHSTHRTLEIIECGVAANRGAARGSPRAARGCCCGRYIELQFLRSDAGQLDARAARLSFAVRDALGRSRESAADGFDGLPLRSLVTGGTVMLRCTVVEVATNLPACWLHGRRLSSAATAQGPGVLRLLTEQLIHYRRHVVGKTSAVRPTMADQ